MKFKIIITFIMLHFYCFIQNVNCANLELDVDALKAAEALQYLESESNYQMLCGKYIKNQGED